MDRLYHRVCFMPTRDKKEGWRVFLADFVRKFVYVDDDVRVVEGSGSVRSKRNHSDFPRYQFDDI